MYASLIPKIKTTLDAVKSANKLARVYDYPVTKFEGFPAAVFLPVAFDNAYLTQAEDRKGYRFKIWIITEVGQAGMAKAWKEVLTPAVDAVLAQFDEDWSQGAIDGHRVWWSLTGGDWLQSTSQDGTVVYAELNLLINLVTSNS